MKHYEEIHALGNKKTKKYLEENGLFKRDFKVGDFVKVDASQLFGIITKIHLSCGKLEKIYFDGISKDGKWVTKNFATFFEGLTHPTDKEILEHLTKVAELKGYKNGVKVEGIKSGVIREIHGLSRFENGRLYAHTNQGYISIWDKETNTWAEIIEEPKYSVRYNCTTGRHDINKDGYYVGAIDNKDLANEICEYLINKK
jgi:hypothetical protein